jgi:hypothetical protein
VTDRLGQRPEGMQAEVLHGPSPWRSRSREGGRSVEAPVDNVWSDP